MEDKISSGRLDHKELQEKSDTYADLTATLETKTERWFQLAERAEEG